MHHTVSLFLVAVGFLQLVGAQFKCSSAMYGRPKLEDCASAYLAMPDVNSRDPEFRLSSMRFFVEPQLLEPPFSTVENDLAQDMEQIPRFWKYKSCRFALLATADAEHHVIDPKPMNTWSWIEREALKVSRNCIGKKLGGGFVFIADPIGTGALSLYQYAVGSQFEDLLNNYMVTSQPIHPPDLINANLNRSLTWLDDNENETAASPRMAGLLQRIQNSR